MSYGFTYVYYYSNKRYIIHVYLSPDVRCLAEHTLQYERILGKDTLRDTITTTDSHTNNGW